LGLSQNNIIKVGLESPMPKNTNQINKRLLHFQIILLLNHLKNQIRAYKLLIIIVKTCKADQPIQIWKIECNLSIF